MVTFYESVVTFCAPSRRYWLDYSTLRVINGINLTLSRHHLRAYRVLIHLFHLCRLNHTLPPLPPPRTPAPAPLRAPPARTSVNTAPITIFATSATLADEDPIEPISDSASRERNRRRRSRRREERRHRSRSRSRYRRPLNRRAPQAPADHRGNPSKASPAVKAMPACRPSGLPRGR